MEKRQKQYDCTHVGYETESNEWKTTIENKLIDTDNSMFIVRGGRWRGGGDLNI